MLERTLQGLELSRQYPRLNAFRLLWAAKTLEVWRPHTFSSQMPAKGPGGRQDHARHALTAFIPRALARRCSRAVIQSLDQGETYDLRCQFGAVRATVTSRGALHPSQSAGVALDTVLRTALSA